MAVMAGLSSEVVLRILGYLDSARDVVRLRQTDRRMYALGSDPSLWKRLFTDTFLLDPSLRPSKRARCSPAVTAFGQSSNEPCSSRRIVTLPKMSEDGANGQRTDWYTLFKVSHNWKTGSYTAHRLRTSIAAEETETEALQTPSVLRGNDSVKAGPGLDLPDTIVESTTEFVFTSSRKLGLSARPGHVLVFPTSVLSSQRKEGIEQTHQEALAHYVCPSLLDAKQGGGDVSTIAVDRSQDKGSKVRVAVAFASGALSIASFDKRSYRFSEELFAAPASVDKVVLAAFHWPYLATCTSDFRIRIDRADAASRQLHRLEERRSYSCHWPACLRLERMSAAQSTLRLTVAYSIPVYPAGWTVGLQEIILDQQGVINSRSASAKRAHVITSIDSPSRSKGATPIGKADSTDQLSRLTSLSYEDPFVVVGTRDNDVFCFRVDGATTGGDTVEEQPLSVCHVRTLHGHTGTVHSVSLNGGRCVTGGSDGSVRIWRLGDEELSVARATGLVATLEGRLRRGLGKVITLRSPKADSPVSTSRPALKRKREATEETGVDVSMPMSLADILRQARQAASTGTSAVHSPSSVIRWVASAFDRIISVSAAPTATRSNGPSCRSEIGQEKRDEELVQIWNFST